MESPKIIGTQVPILKCSYKAIQARLRRRAAILPTKPTPIIIMA